MKSIAPEVDKTFSYSLNRKKNNKNKKKKKKKKKGKKNVTN